MFCSFLCISNHLRALFNAPFFRAPEATSILAVDKHITVADDERRYGSAETARDR
jgi:hypothetical protein